MQCILQAVLGQVDRDDALGTGQARANDGTEADETAAEDGDRRAALDLRRVERRADARREAAGERRTAVERRLGADLGKRDLGHHRVLGERRGAHKVAQLLATTRETGGAVGQVATALLLADCDAAVRARALAVDALPALRRKQRDHVIAGLDHRHALADLLDHAGTLVPEHARCVARGVCARRCVEVRMADAAGLEAHEHLPRLRLRQLDLLDDEWLAEFLEYCGADLHGAKRTRPNHSSARRGRPPSRGWQRVSLGAAARRASLRPRQGRQRA